MKAISDFLMSDQGRMLMANAGEALNPNTKPVNDMTRQQIQTENQMDLMKNLLSGNVPGGKATIDDKGMKIDIPKSMLSQEGMNAPAGIGTSQDTKMTGQMSTTPQLQQQGQSQLSNQNLKDFASLLGGNSPFDFSQISNADLTGLTPQNVQNAINTALAVKASGQQKVKDVVDMKYKQALINQARANTAQTLAPEQESRTSAVKNYEYAVDQGFDGTFKEFQETAKTAHQKDYERAKDEGYDGSFHDWLLEMNESQRDKITIGEKVSEREKAKSTAYLQSPKFQKDLEEYMESDIVRDRLFTTKQDNKERTKQELAIDWMLNSIRGVGGTPTDYNWEGDRLTIKYTTKDGKKENITYGF